MDGIKKTINLGGVLCAFFVCLALLYPFAAQSKSDDSSVFSSTKSNLLPDTRMEQKGLGGQTVLRINPEFYKINITLSGGPKVHFRKPLEQDLYFFFGPYIKDNFSKKKKTNAEFNKVLRELFKFHFN